MEIGCDIKLKLNINNFHTKSEYSEKIKELCDCGFRNYNLALANFEGNVLLSDDYKKHFTNLREALDENNAKAAITHEPFQMPLLSDDIQNRVIEASEILGADWIVIHPYDEDGNEDSAHMKMLADKNYDICMRYAEKLENKKVGMTVETMTDVFKLNYTGLRRHYGDNPYDIIELVDKVNSDKIQMCLDTGHVNTMSLFNIAEIIHAIGPRLKALHIHDNNALADQHYLPFMGTIKWDEVIHALRDINYQGVFQYEADHIPMRYPEELRSSWLRLKADIANYIVNMK